MEYGFDHGLHEECGLFGVYDRDNLDCAHLAYYGLFAQQHRGQQSCGIAVNDDGVIHQYKDMGLVAEVFDDEILDRLTGNMAVGHVRYSTLGSNARENAQPLVVKYVKGTLTVAHNGNLINASSLREQFEAEGAIFQTNADSEVIAYIIARERIGAHSVEEAVSRTMNLIQGAYSLLVMSPRKVIAARDPKGFRPLVIGKLKNSYIFASETSALDAVNAEFIRDVKPGEIVVSDENGLHSIETHCGEKPAHCIFEYIYFARPDSMIDGVSVYDARRIAGRELAKEHPVEADLVLGVPDSGIDAAIGYAEESGIPYGKGFIKSNYVGRTFIQPRQAQRELAVRMKLNPIKSAVNGKRIVMIDDSIVRGTTCARIIKNLKSAGAKEVHVRISSPPFMWPCYFGTDIPSKEELTACQHSLEEIREMLGADSLGFLNMESLSKMVGHHNFCDACFSGNYCMQPTEEELDLINGNCKGKEVHV